jgi:hypothetical protein
MGDPVTDVKHVPTPPVLSVFGTITQRYYRRFFLFFQERFPGIPKKREKKHAAIAGVLGRS